MFGYEEPTFFTGELPRPEIKLVKKRHGRKKKKSNKLTLEQSKDS